MAGRSARRTTTRRTSPFAHPDKSPLRSARWPEHAIRRSPSCVWRGLPSFCSPLCRAIQGCAIGRPHRPVSWGNPRACRGSDINGRAASAMCRTTITSAAISKSQQSGPAPWWTDRDGRGPRVDGLWRVPFGPSRRDSSRTTGFTHRLCRGRLARDFAIPCRDGIPLELHHADFAH